MHKIIWKLRKSVSNVQVYLSSVAQGNWFIAGIYGTLWLTTYRIITVIIIIVRKCRNSYYSVSKECNYGDIMVNLDIVYAINHAVCHLECGKILFIS
jgi:hypothetical protein